MVKYDVSYLQDNDSRGALIDFYLADIEMDDFETRATRQRMNALMGEIHGDSDED